MAEMTAEFTTGLNKDLGKTSNPENGLKARLVNFGRRILSLGRSKAVETTAINAQAAVQAIEQVPQPVQATVVKPTIETNKSAVIDEMHKNEASWKGASAVKADLRVTGEIPTVEIRTADQIPEEHFGDSLQSLTPAKRWGPSEDDLPIQSQRNNTTPDQAIAPTTEASTAETVAESAATINNPDAITSITLPTEEKAA